VVGRLEPVCTRKNFCQFRRIVDKDGKVLRADEKPRPLVFERNQRDLIRVPFTNQTNSLVSGHAHNSRFKGDSGPNRRNRKIDLDGKINKGRIVSARI
jgi:hypothetical protein